jgi:hypothetical protein
MSLREVGDQKWDSRNRIPFLLLRRFSAIDCLVKLPDAGNIRPTRRYKSRWSSARGVEIEFTHTSARNYLRQFNFQE